MCCTAAGVIITDLIRWHHLVTRRPSWHCHSTQDKKGWSTLHMYVALSKLSLQRYIATNKSILCWISKVHVYERQCKQRECLNIVLLVQVYTCIHTWLFPELCLLASSRSVIWKTGVELLRWIPNRVCQFCNGTNEHLHHIFPIYAHYRWNTTKSVAAQRPISFTFSLFH